MNDIINNLEYKKGCLQRRRYELLNQIAECADIIKGIDQKMAILRSQQLEEDLSRDHDV